MPGTAVIIPYFQRQPGLLAAAVRSALTQQDAGPVIVVVCDDASPLPAGHDLATLDADQRTHVILVQRPNGGCGPARNTAFDAVPAGTEWIAFLNSDDRWRPHHLARAIAALREGHDFFFADAQREHEDRTHFEGAAFDPTQHKPLRVMPDLYSFTGDFLTQNLRISPVSISTVVMRASTLGDLRFEPIVFEDLMCWFEVARRQPPVAFDGTLQVDYGHGNMAVTPGWKSPEELANRTAAHNVFVRVARDFSLTAEQRDILRRRMARNRRLFGAVILGHLGDGRLPAWRVVWNFLRLDPRVAGAVPAVAASVLARRLVAASRSP